MLSTNTQIGRAAGMVPYRQPDGRWSDTSPVTHSPFARPTDLPERIPGRAYSSRRAPAQFKRAA
jgi:hypothetical protein